MPFLWTKTIEPRGVTFIRSRRRVRRLKLVMVLGVIGTFGLPTLLRSSFTVEQVAEEWPIPALMALLLGPAVVIVVALGASTVNFRLWIAERRNKHFDISSTPENDTVFIET
jgi:hypothetical protein